MLMAKFNDKDKKQILADYINCQNYSEVARKWNTSKQTIIRIVGSFGQSEVEQKITQKKQENTQTTIEYMQTQHETKKRILDKILEAIESKAEDIDMFTNIKDLATAYGIILDKELKVLELTKDKDKAPTKIMIVNSLPKDDDDGTSN